MVIKLGTPHIISIVVTDIENNPVCNDTVSLIIKDCVQDKFFNGIVWIDTECELSVPHTENGIYSYSFIPESCSVFELTISSRAYSKTKKEMVEVTDSENINTRPVKIEWKTFRNQDGTDTKLVGTDDKPLMGVRISCYDKSTREIVGVAQTDISGEWEMIIRPGIYVFMFEKEGYMSYSFERTVE